MTIFLATLAYLVYIVANAWFDKEEFKHHIWDNHPEGAVYAFLFACGVSSFMIDFGLWFAASFVVYLLAIRWVAFDLFLNLMRGKKWDYVSEESQHSAKLDRLPYFLKIILLAVSVGVLIITYNK